MPDTPTSSTGLAAARREFPGTDNWIYFETSARGLVPAGARDAVARYLDDRIHEGGDKRTMLVPLERARARFAKLIHAEPDEVAIVKNVSEGINAIVTALDWQAGDNAVLCTDIEHPNSIYALYNMRDRRGIEVRAVPPTPDHATPIDTIAATIDAKTRMVIASTVTYTTGAKTDLDALAKLCRARDILLLVDGAQSVGALEFDVRTTLVDAMTVGASKYLCGLYGFGFLYVRRERAERMQPGSLARYGIDLGDAHEGEKGGTEYRLMPAARRFDVGSYNYAGANAVDVSLALIEKVGVPAIEAHVLALAREFTAGLLKLGLPVMSGKVDKHFSHIVIVGKPEHDAATEARLNNLHAHLAAHRVKASIRHGRLRFAFHFYNTHDEVAKVLAIVQQFVAAHA